MGARSVDGENPCVRQCRETGDTAADANGLDDGPRRIGLAVVISPHSHEMPAPDGSGE